MKRIVIKIGSSTIIQSGIIDIVENIVKIKKNTLDIILVSSGAVSFGRLKIPKRDLRLKVFGKKELAAIGQGSLFSEYRHNFAKKNILTGQILIGKNVQHKVLNRLLQHNIVPIVNGNDPDSPDDLMYDDNDSLAGEVAIKLGADLLVIITDVKGVYNTHPDNQNAKQYKHLNKINKELLGQSKKVGSQHGTGGMYTKLVTAQKLLSYGIDTYITSSLRDAKEFIAGDEYRGTLISKKKI